MTEAQATAQQTAINDLNTNLGNSDRTCVLLKMYDLRVFNEYWKAANIPSNRQEAYNAATYEQQVAFIRVAQPIQLSDTFVADFETNAANDAVLNAYLNP
jgi:hypothetical protein